MTMGDDPFADFDEATTSQPISDDSSRFGGHPQRGYSNEVFSEIIKARLRTFFVDVKENRNGKLIKISEKSRGGQKSTIMMDAEDLQQFIEVLQKAQKAL
jgi:hypothetical protein